MKPTQPVGRKKFISSTKKQFLKSCRDYAISLSRSFAAVYNDPNTIVGKLSMAFNNPRPPTSACRCCALPLKASGGKRGRRQGPDLESFRAWLSTSNGSRPRASRWKMPRRTLSPTTPSRKLNSISSKPSPQTPPAPQVDIAPPGMDVQPTPMPIGPAGYDALRKENSLKINIEAVPFPTRRSASSSNIQCLVA